MTAATDIPAFAPALNSMFSEDSLPVPANVLLPIPPKVSNGEIGVVVDVFVADVVSLTRVADEVLESTERFNVVWDGVNTDVSPTVELDNEGTLADGKANTEACSLPHDVERHCCWADGSFGFSAMQLLCHCLHIKEGTVSAYLDRSGSTPSRHLQMLSSVAYIQRQ